MRPTSPYYPALITLAAMGRGVAGTLVSQRNLAVRLFLASLSALGAMGVCYLVMVGTRFGQRFDEAA